MANINKPDNNLLKNIDYKFLIIILLLALICYIQFIQSRNLKKFFYFLYGTSVINQVDYNAMMYDQNILNDQIQNRYRRFNRNRNMAPAYPGNHDIYFEGTVVPNKQMINEDRNTNRWGNRNHNNSNHVLNEHIKRNDSNFPTQVIYDKENNKYVIKINLPKNFDQNNINLTLKNNILVVELLKSKRINDKHKQGNKYVDFSRIFRLPATKATINDIQHQISDDILTIVVPIIE